MGLVQEFREFAVKGNAVDMAVGIIIGGAFGKVVSSLVNDVIMPPIGLATGGMDFSGLAVTLREAGEGTDAVVLGYGLLVNSIVSFLIVAAAVFALVKGINRLRRKEEAAPPPPPGPSAEEKLLGEIRDLLKAGATG